jgi:hypothetical protein
MSRRFRAALGTAILVGAVALPALARADGQPVISLEPTQLGRLPIWIYSDRASPVTTLPIRRVTGVGEDVQIEYDMTATPRPVVTLPVRRVVQDGDSVRIEYDEEGGASLPHTMPSVGGGHNAALWNLLNLPPRSAEDRSRLGQARQRQPAILRHDGDAFHTCWQGILMRRAAAPPVLATASRRDE